MVELEQLNMPGILTARALMARGAAHWQIVPACSPARPPAEGA